MWENTRFPSPIGVIFSLIMYINNLKVAEVTFPSPIGVIFSLIRVKEFLKKFKKSMVSVSYRSYILSYFCEFDEDIEDYTSISFPSPIGVIFSLIRLKECFIIG